MRLARLVFNNIFDTTIFEIISLIRDFLDRAPQLVQQSYPGVLPELHHYRTVLKMYPSDFTSTSMQHPEEHWELTKDTAKKQTYDCNVMKNLMPGVVDIWDHDDFKAHLQA